MIYCPYDDSTQDIWSSGVPSGPNTVRVYSQGAISSHLGALFHSILPRANTGCSVYLEIHLCKREILKEFDINIPFLRRI